MTAGGKIIRRFSPLLKKIYALYAWFDHTYRFRGLKILVKKGIFNPILFNSSIDVLNFIEKNFPEPGKMIELGCGSGLISVYFGRKGWNVWSVDLNDKALENTRINAERNNVSLEALHSDLYTNIKEQMFDLCIINPPYFNSQVRNIDDAAWFCGKDFEYYTNLFGQMKERDLDVEKTFMVLSDQCDLQRISATAQSFDLDLKNEHQFKHSYESVIIFRIIPHLFQNVNSLD